MDVTKIPAWFRETPAGQRMIIDHEKALSTKREQLASERAAAIAERDKAIAAVLKTEAKAKAALDAANSVVAERLAALRDVQAERQSTAARFERTIAGLERQLRESADNAAIDEFLSEIEMRRQRDLRLQTETSERRTFLGNEQVITRSNARSVAALNEALLVARKQVELLRLSASRDVQAEIAVIRDSLPPVVMEKINTQHQQLMGA